MSHAEAAVPVGQAAEIIPENQLPAGQLPANHLFDTVLPVRPAMVNRGSVERMRPGLIPELLAAGSAKAMLLSGRHALVHGDALVLAEAGPLLDRLERSASGPAHIVYLGAALGSEDLPAGTGVLLFILPERVGPDLAGLPAGAAW